MIFQNTAYDILFNAPVITRTWDIYISQDGAPYNLSTTSSIIDNNDKSYTLAASAADMNANIVNFKIVETNTPYYYIDNPIELEISIVTDAPITNDAADYLNEIEDDISTLKEILPGVVGGDNTVVWTYTMYTDSTYTIPLESCLVKMTADPDGLIDLKEQYTTATGETKWLVVPGATYYLWRQKSQWRFTNPDTQTISLIAPFSAMTSVDTSISTMSISTNMTEYVIWTYRVYADINYTIPLENCLIKIKDSAGKICAPDQHTNSLGETQWRVIPGATYYLYREKPQWKFNDPDIQVIPTTAPFISS